MVQNIKGKSDASFDTKRMFEHACAFFDCARNCEIEPNNIKYRRGVRRKALADNSDKFYKWLFLGIYL